MKIQPHQSPDQGLFRFWRLRKLYPGHSIPPAGLDTQQPHSRRIRHPQAATNTRDSLPVFRPIDAMASVRVTVSGGMGREPKKTPLARFLVLAQSCGYPIRPCCSSTQGNPS